MTISFLSNKQRICSNDFTICTSAITERNNKIRFASNKIIGYRNPELSSKAGRDEISFCSRIFLLMENKKNLPKWLVFPSRGMCLPLKKEECRRVTTKERRIPTCHVELVKSFKSFSSQMQSLHNNRRELHNDTTKDLLVLLTICKCNFINQIRIHYIYNGQLIDEVFDMAYFRHYLTFFWPLAERNGEHYAPTLKTVRKRQK